MLRLVIALLLFPMVCVAQNELYTSSFKKPIELSELLTENGRSAIVMNTLKWSDIEGRSVVRVDSVARRKYDVIEFHIQKVDSVPFVLVLSGDGNQTLSLEASGLEKARTSISFLIQAGIMEEKPALKLKKKLR